MGELAALGAAAALAAMLFASRLPSGPEFLLPRRGGFGLYRAAWALFGARGGREVFSGLIVLVLIACAGALALSLRRAQPKRWPASWSARAGLVLGPLFAAFLAASLVGRFLDLITLVWFPYASMDVREPFAVFALAALAFAPAAAAAQAWLSGRRRRATLLLAALMALDAGASILGAARGVGRPLDLPEARGQTLYVVLNEGPSGPGHDEYRIPPDIFTDADARSRLFEIASGPVDARVLPALRRLYEEEAKRGDSAGLRRALILGADRGDVLAPSILLAHLASVAPSAEARDDLGELADERKWRVGPLGAAAFSRAYAHLGDAADAARWAEKAGGPRGVAPGLLGGAEERELRSGRISGKLRAPGRARVALYRKADPAAPYLLDAGGLVASVEPDAYGRFSFSGLTAGRYYLAVAVSAGDGEPGDVSVSGNRGDLVLAARRTSLFIPSLSLKLRSR
jgi:hypothetical protein